MTRKQAYKNALSLYIVCYGAAIYFGGSVGLQRYMLTAVNGNAEAVKFMGALVLVFGIMGFFMRAKPVYIWVILIPYMLYAITATYGASLTPNATPSGIVQYFAPIILTFAYTWERTDV